jgi:hypothetical protein
MIDVFFKCSDLNECYNLIPDGLKSFIEVSELSDKILELKNNTSGLSSFKKRFFGWFNMFKIVKYLNFVHKDLFEKVPVEIAAYELLEITGIRFESKKPLDLLLYYRRMEKELD